VAPIDFRMPISRVRCVTETSMMLASPTPPMARVSAADEAEQQSQGDAPSLSMILLEVVERREFRTARSSFAGGDSRAVRASVSRTWRHGVGGEDRDW
jgi:hypothetical protein